MDEFIKVDYCTHCEGFGYIETHHQETAMLYSIEREQCEACIELQELELKADILEDEMKGN